MFVSILLVRATKKRDHSNMMPFMILMIIGLVLSFLQIFSVGWGGVFIAILIAGIDFYAFLCIYSLYDKFRSEKLGGGQVFMQTQVIHGNQPVVYMQQQPQYVQQPQFNQQQYMQQPAAFVQQHQAPPSYSQQQPTTVSFENSEAAVIPQKTVL